MKIHAKQSEIKVGAVTSFRGEEGPQGKPGPKGDPGYTPVRGKDYWTEEDQAAVDDAKDAAQKANTAADQANDAAGKANVAASAANQAAETINEKVEAAVAPVIEDVEEIANKINSLPKHTETATEEEVNNMLDDIFV